MQISKIGPSFGTLTGLDDRTMKAYDPVSRNALKKAKADLTELYGPKENYRVDFLPAAGGGIKVSFTHTDEDTRDRDYYFKTKCTLEQKIDTKAPNFSSQTIFKIVHQLNGAFNKITDTMDELDKKRKLHI